MQIQKQSSKKYWEIKEKKIKIRKANKYIVSNNNL